MGRRQPASRIDKVLEAGEAHAQKTLLGRLPTELTERILRKVKTPLQTCAIVRRMCETGELPCQTRIDHLNLIRIVFFEATSLDDDQYVKLSAVLLIVNAIFHFPSDFKMVLERLCESYERATKAIFNMERPLPWRGTGFDWGTPPSEIVAYSQMPRYIDVFTLLNTAGKLTHAYLEFDDADASERQRLLQDHQDRINNYRRDPNTILIERSTVSRIVRPYPLITFVNHEYEQRYKQWYNQREDFRPLLHAEDLPEQFRDPAWLPAHSQRRDLRSLWTRVDNTGAVVSQYFEYGDPERGPFATIRVDVPVIEWLNTQD